jgi:hypothetical protein
MYSLTLAHPPNYLGSSNRCAANEELKNLVNKAFLYSRNEPRAKNSVFPTHRTIFADGFLRKTDQIRLICAPYLKAFLDDRVAHPLLSIR